MVAGRQMVLEKVLESSTLDPQAARRPLGHAWALETQCPPAMRHFNKPTPIRRD